ncbi:MAG TPA: MFS transporter [Rhizomicrobium sp.]|jgi:MFS family permease
MTVVAESIAPPRAGMGAGVVTLLAIAVFINYVDRGNLATAAPLMKDELHLTASQLGFLFSAFFWTYIPSQLLAGWLAERINAYRTLAIGLAIWSAATALSGLATGFAVLITLRLVLGIGESAAFPCASKLIARHLPLHQLGVANGAVATGLALGPAFGTFVGGMLMAYLGWRVIFLLFGLASLLWLVPWLNVARDAGRRTDDDGPANVPSYLSLLACRELWGACIGHFSSNYAFYFVITWLPLYLVKSRGFTVPEMATLAGVVYLIFAASTQVCGWVSDFWMRRGASANRVRKTLMVTSQIGVATMMLGCAVGGTNVCIVSLLLAGVFFGPGTANVYAIGQSLAGPHASGKWMSIQNCIGNISGAIGPLITGYVVDRTGDFLWAFAIACGFTLMGVIAWGIIIPRVEPLAWPQHR